MTATFAMTPGTTSDAPTLTTRELEVINAWLGHGSKADAAAALYLSENTVRTHITRIRAKYAFLGLDVSTKARLLHQVKSDGLI